MSTETLTASIRTMPESQEDEERSMKIIEAYGDELLRNPGRTKTFQAFLDSLDTRAVRKAKTQESKPVRPVFGNYATKRG